MANTIKIKNSGTSANVPSAASLEYGELALNYADGKLYFKTGTSTVDFLKSNITIGTDTTGNYVAGVTAGTGVTVTGSGSEGATPTVAIGQSVATSATPQFAGLTSTGTTATSVLTVDGIEIDTTGASTNQVLKHNGTKFVPATGAFVTVSDTPPTSPTPQAGDQWYESDTGRQLIYYDGFWVEIGSTATTNVNANDLSGTTLASNVVSSSLTSFGSSPVLTGTPTAPTASAGTNTTQVATMASKPWNTAWGVVAYTTSISGTISSNVVSGITTTFTAISNRRYKITAHLSTAVQSGRHIITTSTTSLGGQRIQDLSEVGFPHAEGTLIVTGNGTSQTVTVVINTVTGTMNLAADGDPNKHFLLIEDIGAA